MYSVIDSLKGFGLANTLVTDKVLKTGIGLVSIEPTETTLTGVNQLDGNNFTIPEGFHFSVGPEGEVQVLIDQKGRSTAPKLYAFETEMNFPTAYAIAEAQGVNVAPMQAAYIGLGLLTFHNPRKFVPQVRWMRSKGMGRMGIFAFSGKVAKPSWFNPSEGPGSAVQTFEEGDAFFISDVTNEVYVINKKAQLQWASANNGRPIVPADMPKLTESDLAGCIVSSHESETAAQAAAEELAITQRAELGL